MEVQKCNAEQRRSNNWVGVHHINQKFWSCALLMEMSTTTTTDTKEFHALVQQLINPEQVWVSRHLCIFAYIAVSKQIFILLHSFQRETALLELSKKRESFPDLAPVLWHSYGTIAALLQEIISIYPMLSPPTLSPHASNRVCNALALLQCVASHSETKAKLMNGEWADAEISIYFLFLILTTIGHIVLSNFSAQIPLYLYPFLNTVSRHRPFEYLRLTSLGVIGALVKVMKSFNLLTARPWWIWWYLHKS